MATNGRDQGRGRGFMYSSMGFRRPAPSAAGIIPQGHAGIHISASNQQPYQGSYHSSFPMRTSSDFATPSYTPPFVSTQYDGFADASQEPPQNHFFHTHTTPSNASSERGASSDRIPRVASPQAPMYITSQEPAILSLHRLQEPNASMDHQLAQDMSQFSLNSPRLNVVPMPLQQQQPMHHSIPPDEWLKRSMGVQAATAGHTHLQGLGDVPSLPFEDQHISARHVHPPVYQGGYRPMPRIKLLAPIQRVQDAVSESAEYSLDPFCPTNMEFQRMAEDELTKFIYKLVETASKMNLAFKYENPATKTCDMTASEALQGPALDFRWQMKHLEYNRTLFCREVFRHRISESDLRTSTRSLKEKADRLAHKQHLQDDLRVKRNAAHDGVVDKEEKMMKSEAKTGTTTAILNLLDEIIQFTEKIFRSLIQIKIPGLQIHRMNLRDIREIYLNYLEYKEMLHENMATFEKMDNTQKRNTASEVLRLIADHCENLDNHEAQAVVAVRLAAHFSISLPVIK